MTYSRDTDVGWIWVEADFRIVMDNYGFPQVVPFCNGPWERQDYEET